MEKSGVNKSMFEQSILLPDPSKKRWTFAASLLVEVSAVSVLLLIPLVYTERMGLGWIQSSFMALPPRPLAKAVPVQRSTTQPTSTRRRGPFDPPIRIPTTPPVILVDNEILADCQNCVVNAVPSTTPIYNAVDLGRGNALPPPQPPPKPKNVETKKPASETATSGPIKVGGFAQEAKIIRRVIPTYPVIAKQTRTQGTVKLLGVISTEGRIERLQVLSGHPLLVPAAVDAVRQWIYRPTLLNGNPVEVQAPIEVNFILSN